MESFKTSERNNFDKQFTDQTLPPIQDLSNHHKELLQKNIIQKKDPMKVKILKTLTH